MTTPLVAEAGSSTTWYTGLALVEDVTATTNGIQGNGWVDATLGGVGTSLDTLAMVVDPLGTLVSWGVAWLMEHVRPLKEALDWLAGNPDEIAAHAATWSNVARHSQAAAEDHAQTVRAGTAQWSGASGDAYRAHAEQHGSVMRGIATAAQGIAAAVEGAGLLVALVRGIVRDLIAEFIGTLAARLPQWLAEAGVTLGLATPVVISQVVALVAKWVNKIQKFVRALLNSLRRLRPMLDKLGTALRDLTDLAKRLGRSDPMSMASTSASSRSSTPGWQVGDAIPGPRDGGGLPPDATMLAKYQNETDPNEPWPFRPFRTPVHYMTAEEKESTRLFVDGGGRLRSTVDGALFDTSANQTLHGGAGKAIFVMDEHGNLYATSQELGVIHHSSFLGGKPVVGAGEIEVRDGVLVGMTDKSGHYQPKPEMNDRVLLALRGQGMLPDPQFKIYDWNGLER